MYTYVLSTLCDCSVYMHFERINKNQKNLIMDVCGRPASKTPGFANNPLFKKNHWWDLEPNSWLNYNIMSFISIAKHMI